ncbi:MAG: hypothetical protein LAP38_02020 [Acidobacteriia bacterium]|nr:hypothetical protein [Terriglobia bacterium]
MASSRTPSTRPSPNISTAAAKTRSVIRDLQTRLTEAGHPGPGVHLAPAERQESEEELERQLQAYFARSVGSGGTSAGSRTRILDELRSRVIDGVVDRILNEWAGSQPDAPAAAGLRDEVMERLIERVLQQLRASNGTLQTALPS